jgi:hypothetical protein
MSRQPIQVEPVQIAAGTRGEKLPLNNLRFRVILDGNLAYQIDVKFVSIDMSTNPLSNDILSNAPCLGLALCVSEGENMLHVAEHGIIRRDVCFGVSMLRTHIEDACTDFTSLHVLMHV